MLSITWERGKGRVNGRGGREGERRRREKERGEGEGREKEGGERVGKEEGGWVIPSSYAL